MPASLGLLVDGVSVGPIRIAHSPWSRARGLLGMPKVNGAVMFPGTRSIHTVGMRFAIDVAGCNEELVVLHTRTDVGPGHLVGPVRGVRIMVEAAAGSFMTWQLQPGSQLGISG